MIIEKQTTQIYLDFGDGDIGSFGTKDIVDGNKRVTMWFYQDEEGEIGRKLVKNANEIYHFPVIMTFRKKESLETVIKNLNELLELFTEE